MEISQAQKMEQMSVGQAFLPEWDHEMAMTRTHLLRLPEDKLGWKPHAKSMTMGGLATHIANIPFWALLTINQDEFDVAPPGKGPFKLEEAKSRSEVLENFDKNCADARTALAGVSDEAMFKPWSLLSGGKVIMTMPRAVVMRGFVLNHMIHHRAQFGVYLRINGIPVPATYGPSADEGQM